jgi:hypothetical protein
MIIRGPVSNVWRLHLKMAEAKKDSQREDGIWSFLLPLTLLSFYLFYLLFRVDPRLIYQAQEPVFFLDAHFMKGFFGYPGGINELIAGFLSQFFYTSWTGSLLLVLVFWLIAWNTKALIRSKDADRPVLYLHWVPTVVLLALHSSYRFPLVLTLGVLWALIGIHVYICFSPSSRLLRGLLYTLLQVTLYYIVAGQVFLFTILVILYEVLRHRGIGLPLLYAIVAGLIPSLGASMLFMIHLPDAYLRHLTSYHTYQVTWWLWGVYLFFPMALLWGMWRQRPVTVVGVQASGLWDRLVYRPSRTIRRIQDLLFLCVVVVVALSSYEKEGKAFLRMDYYAQHQQWDKVIQTAREGMSNSYYGLYQANRALYHSGCLCDELFTLAQFAGDKGLFLPNNQCQLLPLRQSDVFFDLGLVNEAQHWAHEAVSVTGDSPWNLQRLVWVNLVKGDRIVAAKYLGLLKKTLWYRGWARTYDPYLSPDRDISGCPELGETKDHLPGSDFLVSPTEPERCLEELAKNTRNKMAFEYFMSYCLLKGDLSRFIAELHRLNDLEYTRIPRHFEEAILVYMQLTGKRDVLPSGKVLSQETIREFNEFNQIVTKHKRDKKAAYGELVRYKDTYWFYGMYYYQAKES